MRDHEEDGVDALHLAAPLRRPEHPLQEAEPAIRDAAFGAEPRRALERRPVSELHEGPVGEEEVEERRRPPLAVVSRRSRPMPERRHDELAYLPVHALLHRLVERLLRREVVVEASRRGCAPDARCPAPTCRRGPVRANVATAAASTRSRVRSPLAPAGRPGRRARRRGGAHSTQRFIARTRALGDEQIVADGVAAAILRPHASRRPAGRDRPPSVRGRARRRRAPRSSSRPTP